MLLRSPPKLCTKVRVQFSAQYWSCRPALPRPAVVLPPPARKPSGPRRYCAATSTKRPSAPSWSRMKSGFTFHEDPRTKAPPWKNSSTGSSPLWPCIEYLRAVEDGVVGRVHVEREAVLLLLVGHVVIVRRGGGARPVPRGGASQLRLAPLQLVRVELALRAGARADPAVVLVVPARELGRRLHTRRAPPNQRALATRLYAER
ncbi:Protein of unknown function, partial [Gryllus bimaculatus]